jgi:hypothetical protein
MKTGKTPQMINQTHYNNLPAVSTALRRGFPKEFKQQTVMIHFRSHSPEKISQTVSKNKPQQKRFKCNHTTQKEKKRKWH